MGIPLLFGLPAWRTALLHFFEFLGQPSLDHLFSLLNTRGFLVFVIIYFGAVCIFYSDKFRKLEDRIESEKRQLEIMADYKAKRRSADIPKA
jgi:hypothetical protein